MYSCYFYFLRFTCPWMVKVGENPGMKIILSAPNDVVWKQLFYFLMLFRNQRDDLFSHTKSSFKGCTGSSNLGIATLPPEQHIPGIFSFRFNNAPQNLLFFHSFHFYQPIVAIMWYHILMQHFQKRPRFCIHFYYTSISFYNCSSWLPWYFTDWLWFCVVQIISMVVL